MNVRWLRIGVRRFVLMTKLETWRLAYFDCWKKTFDFKSKAKRINFWVFLFSNVIFLWFLDFAQDVWGSLIASAYHSISNASGFSLLMLLADIIFRLLSISYLLLFLGFLVAGFSLCIRRLRDIGKSPAWIILLFCCQPWLLFWFAGPSAQSSKEVV